MDEILIRLESMENEIKELRQWRDHEQTRQQLAEIDEREAEQRFQEYIKKREAQIAKQQADTEQLKKLMI